MGTPLDDLVDLLDIEVLDLNLFRGVSPDEDRQRVFGGQVAAQALVAAGRTVDRDRFVHSLHSYFLRPGDPHVPIIYDVDRIRDGKSFTTRRVVAIQHGEAIFNLAASFQVAEDGPDHSIEMPDVPDPGGLPNFRDWVEPHADRLDPAFAQWLMRDRAIDLRHTREPHWLGAEPRLAEQDVWIKAVGELPDDPLLHACVVAYASDVTLLDTVTIPHAIWFHDNYQFASLDHAMWFHRPFRADDWLLYHQESPSASGARGLALGYVFRQDGALAITVMQEGLVRPIVTPPETA
jgi:acyl-CoA thioesterase II